MIGAGRSLPLLILSLALLSLAVRKQVCVDTEDLPDCIAWKNAGYCNETNEYYEYMTGACNKTCELCGEERQHACNPKRQFPCLAGFPRCVPIAKMCDDTVDCEDGHDETDCNWGPEVQANDVLVNDSFGNSSTLSSDLTATPRPDLANNVSVRIVYEDESTNTPSPAPPDGMQCAADEYGCLADIRCIKRSMWCDGWIRDCSDGEDETGSDCFTRINKDFIRDTYKKAHVFVKEFSEAFLTMTESHCTSRMFSCAGVCSEPYVLNSTLCACDKDCYARKDCCQDVQKECKHSKPELVESCSPNLFGANRNISALVVEDCPETATEKEWRLCKERENLSSLRFYGAPVFSSHSNTHYRNYYCAACNRERDQDIVPWNVWYDCQSTEADFDDCNSIIFVPPASKVKTCTVHNFTYPSFTEDKITPAQRSGLAVQRCQTVYAPVKYNETMYRNPYCMYLARNQAGDRKKTRLHTCDFEKALDPGCPAGTIPCRPTFSCISEDLRCDGFQDCPDRSDEPDNCPVLGSCYGKFRCKRTKHECIFREKVCDGFFDCTDKSDEANCFSDDRIEYRDNINYIFPELTRFPVITNNYVGKGSEDENITGDATISTVEAMTSKFPICVEPLEFDGLMCKYNKTMEIGDKDYLKVYYKQALLTATYNFTLSRVGYRRPADLSDNPPEFLMRHLVKHPYQIVNFDVGTMSKRGIREGYLEYRMLTDLETYEQVIAYVQTDRDRENFVQIGTEVYEISMRRTSNNKEVKKLKTAIKCELDNSGARPKMICTSCAYLEYSSHEYTITSTGTLSLNSNQQTLKFDEYELRANNSILVCWDTPNVNSTDSPVNYKSNWIQTWYGVGYSLALLVHLTALVTNLLVGRKTTLRIFLINYTTMCLIWSLDSLLSSVTALYSDWALSLHLFGNLGTLAWLLIISFHLLLSVSDGNPAVYFSVDNLVFYHVCGWMCPLGWTILFFILGKMKAIEEVTSLTDPSRTNPLNQSSAILHFPIWVLVVVIFFLLVIIIATTQRLMGRKSSRVDVEVMARRLQIKMMILMLFALAAVPWVCAAVLKHLGISYLISNIVSCISCIFQGFFVIFMLRCLVVNKLEILQGSTSTPDSTVEPSLAVRASPSVTPESRPALPPKVNKGPRPPSYQRPIDRDYTLFPEQRRAAEQQARAREKERYREHVDDYAHLHGGVLGGASRGGRGKEYYPMTVVEKSHEDRGAAVHQSSVHQYMPLIRNSGSPASSVGYSPNISRAPVPAQRTRHRTTSSQESAVVHESSSQVPPPLSDKGKHRVRPRSGVFTESLPPTSERVRFGEGESPSSRHSSPHRSVNNLEELTPSLVSSSGRKRNHSSLCEDVPPSYESSLNQSLTREYD